jgi:hypothetical protein
VIESVHDDDDGDFNPAKRLSTGKSKSGKRLRAGAKSGIDDVQEEDAHVELQSALQKKKKPKTKKVASSNSTDKPVEGKSQSVAGQRRT